MAKVDPVKTSKSAAAAKVDDPETDRGGRCPVYFPPV